MGAMKKLHMEQRERLEWEERQALAEREIMFLEGRTQGNPPQGTTTKTAARHNYNKPCRL